MKNTLVKQRKPSSDSVDKNYKPSADKSYTPMAIAVITFFLGVGTTMGVYTVTLIDFYGLTKILAGAAISGFLIPLKLYRKWFHFIKYEVVIFNILGVTPFLTALFLVLNFSITSERISKDYRIEKIYTEGIGDRELHGVILEGNAFSDERKIVEIDDLDFIGFSEKILFRVETAKGLFGLTVIKNREFIQQD